MSRQCFPYYLILAVLGSVALPISAGTYAQDDESDDKKTADPKQTAAVRVGSYPAEIRRTFTTQHGLPTNSVLAVAVLPGQQVFAGTPKGLYQLNEGQQWTKSFDYSGPVKLLAVQANRLICTAEKSLYAIENGAEIELAKRPSVGVDPIDQHSLAAAKRVFLGTTSGLYELAGGTLEPVEELNRLLGDDREIRQVATNADGEAAVATDAGLFVAAPDGPWQAIYPRDGIRSWAPVDARGATYDSRGRLWFACPQGVGVRDGDGWILYTGAEGLPYNDFTTIVPGEEGVMWFATKMGAIRFDGTDWNYRMAPRWLPDNLVLSVAADDKGNAYFATEQGAGMIERRPITLADKARYFEDEIDKYNRRTQYGFVLSARLKQTNDKREWENYDSDNDGLWTAMYGAGECFAYAATKDPQAKARAKAAFEALRFLGTVTQGGNPPARPGFVARTVLPTSGPNPNATHYTPEKDREEQLKDPLWKVIVPRWPTSADGQWYWKCDTSSDELDGHYFLYAVYYDLVADTEEEKARVRQVVKGITDHLIENDYSLIDHDGKPTRWARYGPDELNGNILQGGRGLNSLSILSYLKTAEHMTGDVKYRKAYDELVTVHFYATNILDPKKRTGPGTGNQSDDEMAFMCYYNLINYETDPKLREMYQWSLRWYWLLEAPERNPLFNFIFLALDDRSWMEAMRVRARDKYLVDAVDTLKRIPLDRVEWGYKNSHRIDVIKFRRGQYRRGRNAGNLPNGEVVPIDERELEHWNQDPWSLDGGGDGKTLTDGAGFLLPYYMGLYHGFIEEEPELPVRKIVLD